MQDTRAILVTDETDFPGLRRKTLDTLQVNLGYLCNLSCVHCHVNAGPSRTEMMDAETVELVLEVLRRRRLTTLDLTGGAPEMNPHFRYLVREARAMGVQVVDRCNLIILNEPGYEDLAEFLAGHGVHVVASLPCYMEDNVEKQRGKGVFDGSMTAIAKLNDQGYGGDESGLQLDLVYNPVGAHLPPPQQSLQADYQRELGERFGIRFNQLLTITNMPISRFGAVLLAKGEFHQYMALLRDNHNDGNLDNVMCRSMVSVDYRGHLYDCDFNQMLDMPLRRARGPGHLLDLLEWDPGGHPVYVADHCFGCTAGAGSSCGGALG